ncbi:carbon-nitrogen hydrolase family protein [Algoriphagus chordae]|uniref:Carbon-nitrogen hydrolase n=1 Tax=Algoriphagus chordae TaxID=237019 RepID=A0A2W7R5E9_9BACT|nr:hypothetical protein [Algoriphagus chordae]PZX55704.1 hypothetical protein LV85_00929 [Algoriphagus chordae]
MIRKLITLFIFTVFVWLIWSFSGRNTPLEEGESYLSVVEEINPSDSLKRNILGIQPYMVATDYFDQIIYKEKIRQYLVAANAKAFIGNNTLIIYPENIGTWLVLIGEKHRLAAKKSLKEMMKTLAMSNAFDFFLGYLKTGNEANKESSAIFRMKAKTMLAAYYKTFSELSAESKTYIIAGSIVLPSPRVVDGNIYLELDGPLYNASFLFGPEGKVLGDPILRPFPNSELAKDSQITQVFELPFGKTSVSICSNEWHKKPHASNENYEQASDFISTFCTGEHAMTTTQDGASLVNNTEQQDSQDIGRLTSYDSNQAKSQTTAPANKIATVGLEVFLHGELWDLKPTGKVQAMLNSQVLPVTPAVKGGVWSLNF